MAHKTESTYSLALKMGPLITSSAALRWWTRNKATKTASIWHTRMKRSGAWWVKETGNAMLRIRCAIYNGTYHKVFDKYKKNQIPL